MLKTIEVWLTAHPVARGVLWMIVIGVVGAVYNWVTYKRSEAEWKAYEKAHPKKAAFIRLMRIVFPHLRKFFPALAALLPDPPPKTPKPPVLPLLLLSLGLGGCSFFRPSKTGEPPPAQAVVLYTARTLAMLNAECAKHAEAILNRAKADVVAETRLATLKKGEALRKECDDATVAGRGALEAVELAIESGTSLADGKVGCAIKRGLAATSDVCTAMRVAKVIDKCPDYVDTAVTFGSPLITVSGACSK